MVINRASALIAIILFTFCAEYGSLYHPWKNSSSISGHILDKFYCRQERDDIADQIRYTDKPRNKTLVVILLNTKSHHITWNNFEKFLLKAISADLSLTLLSPFRTMSNVSQSVNSFRSNAKFVWDVDLPKDGDFMHYFDQIATSCFNHSFNANYAKVIGTLNLGSTGWLGCIRTSGRSSCAALTWLLSWITMQKILSERLYEQYSQIVFTRSDYLWIANHIHPSVMSWNERSVWVPETSPGFKGGGLHFMVLHDASRISALTK